LAVIAWLPAAAFEKVRSAGIAHVEDVLKIKTTETTYLEYRLGGHGLCDIYYKRMSKMDTADTNGTAPDPDIKLIRKDMAAMKLAGRTHDDAPIYGHYDLPGHRATTAANVVATKSNKGEMHLVKPGSLVTFNHP
jgi:hypothetical protein